MATCKSIQDPWSGTHPQVHLDFHNSPYITDLAAEFDAPTLVRRFKQA